MTLSTALPRQNAITKQTITSSRSNSASGPVMVYRRSVPSLTRSQRRQTVVHRLRRPLKATPIENDLEARRFKVGLKVVYGMELCHRVETLAGKETLPAPDELRELATIQAALSAVREEIETHGVR